MKSRRSMLVMSVVTTLLVTVFLLPSVALASPGSEIQLDYVDIGDKGSESGHMLLGWGPIEPATTGGSWGGIDDCRVTWEKGSRDRIVKRMAVFTLKIPCGYCATRLELDVLDGLADDSFIVYVGCKKVYSYTGENNGTENWITHEIDIDKCSSCRSSKCILVTIIATGPAWGSFDTYGQLALNEAALYGEERSCEPICRPRCRR